MGHTNRWDLGIVGSEFKNSVGVWPKQFLAVHPSNVLIGSNFPMAKVSTCS